MKYTCPCCGYIVLESEIHDICPVCWWQDDPISRTEPDFVGGANGNVSLRQAQVNFALFGVSDRLFLNDIRSPDKNDKRDPNWKPFEHKKE